MVLIELIEQCFPQEQHSTFRANLLQVTSQHQESVEELIHILAILLDQARDVYFTLHTRAQTAGEFDRELAVYRYCANYSVDLLNHLQVTSEHQESVEELIHILPI